MKFVEKDKNEICSSKDDAKHSDKALIDRLIPLIADHFGEVYDIPRKKKSYAICRQYNMSVGNSNSKNDTR